MKVCIAGAAGAFGRKHFDAIKKIKNIEIVSIVGNNLKKIQNFAKIKDIPHATTDLSISLKRKDIDCVILATPTKLHANQAIECMHAGKHVMIEIPMADNIKDSKRLINTQKETGLIAMVGHTRRFNPSHQWIHNKIMNHELKIQQMDVQTYFFRRSNTNAKGEPRTWTDHLLWHHACHTVDLFQYQTGQEISKYYALQGPINNTLGIAMDMNIGLKVPNKAICTLSLSFNNNGPFGTFFRYICDNGTYLARYDELYDGEEKSINLLNTAISMNGIELQDREFFNAINENREPNSSVQQCFSTMNCLNKIEKYLNK